MMKRIGTLGIAVLVPLALLVACGNEAEPERTPTPSSLTTNECGWPDHCSPMTARAMLEEIRSRAQAELPQQGIDPADLAIIESEVIRCLKPGLTSTKSTTHVCKVTKPEACTELKGIYDKTDPIKLPPDPPARRGHWHTIATDLQSFPSGK